MIRLVLGEDGAVAVDLAGRSFGRGAWVHARPECLAGAAAGGADRSFRTRTRLSVTELTRGVREAAARRVEALVGSARAAGALAAGADAVSDAVTSGRAELVLVAEDARAAAEVPAVLSAGAAGRACRFGTAATVGRAAGRAETAVVSIHDAGLAAAIRRAVALASMPEPGAGAGTDFTVPEDR